VLDVNFFDKSRSVWPRLTTSATGHGEVKKPETINYRTLKPESGRSVLREDLRPDPGLGVLLRQVQARALQGHHL
jgi:hypothetical protein